MPGFSMQDELSPATIAFLCGTCALKGRSRLHNKHRSSKLAVGLPVDRNAQTCPWACAHNPMPLIASLKVRVGRYPLGQPSLGSVSLRAGCSARLRAKRGKRSWTEGRRIKSLSTARHA